MASGGAKLLTCTRPPDYYQANTQIYRPIHNNTYSIKCIFDKLQCHHIQVPSNVLAKVNSFKVTYIWTCPASEALSCRPNTLYKSLQHYVIIHPIIYNKKDSLHILHHSKYYYTQEILKICTWYYSTYTYYLQATTISQITLLEYKMLKKTLRCFYLSENITSQNFVYWLASLEYFGIVTKNDGYSWLHNKYTQ